MAKFYVVFCFFIIKIMFISKYFKAVTVGTWVLGMAACGRVAPAAREEMLSSYRGNSDEGTPCRFVNMKNKRKELFSPNGNCYQRVAPGVNLLGICPKKRRRECKLHGRLIVSNHGFMTRSVSSNMPEEMVNSPGFFDIGMEINFAKCVSCRN